MEWDSDEDVDDSSSEINYNEPSYVLIAIDADEKMFEHDETLGKSTFVAVLSSCVDIMDGLLLKGPRQSKSNIAISVISNDEDKSNLCRFDGSLPESFKKLKELAHKTNDELKSMYQRNGPLDFAHFLLQSKKLLSTCGSESTKYIAYVSKDDDPVGGDEDLKYHAVNQAKSLVDFNIRIELLVFTPYFEYDTFFREILFSAGSTFSYEYLEDTNSLKEKLLGLVQYRWRKIKFYPFDEADKYFEVIEKKYIKGQKVLNNVIVIKDTFQEVKKLQKQMEFGNTYKVSYSKNRDPMDLTAEEKEVLCNNEVSTGFTLLGTYSKLVNVGMHVSDPVFVQRNTRENSPYFDIFWQYCVDRNRVLLCTRKYKSDGPVKLVELSPKVINGIRSFLVLGIPFQENITYKSAKHKVEESVPTKMEMQVTEELIKAASFKYDPSLFHDTVFCKRREYIRSELLEEPPREVENIVDVKVVEDLTDVINNFKEICFSSKRKNAEGGNVRKKKK